LPSNRRGLAARDGRALTGATAGPVTVRLPSEVAQRVQRNSCSSPEGRTRSRRSRTGWERPHFGQYSSLAVNLPNCCGISLRVFVFKHDFLDVLEGDHDLLGRRAFLHLQMHIIGRNAADTLSDVLAPR
jgi:hypothetical protein